jgi:PAS domain S-box-containing protein
VSEPDDTLRSAEPTGSRLEFETLISDLSSRFVNLPAGELDGAIESALRGVCELLDIDLAVLWQWSTAAPDVIAPTHSFPARDGSRPPEAIDQEQYPWLVEQMRAGHPVVLPTLEQLPAEAAVDLKYARLGGIKSSLCLPLTLGGEQPVGALAFNTLRTQRNWPGALVHRLQLVAQVFANALARKRSDEALRESEERLSLAADSADAGLWVLDYATQTFWITDRTRSIFGFSADETITMERLEAVVHPDDWGLVAKTIEQAARPAEEPVTVDYRIILPGEGVERWVSSRGRPRLTASGTPDRLMGVSIDVTERKREQEALVASEARLASGAELAGLGFYEIDFSSGVMHADEQLIDLCGVPPERTRGLGVLEVWLEHLHPDDRPRVMELRRRLHEGEADRFSLEYRYLHPTRGQLWLQHLAGVATRDADGQAVRVHGVFRDITGRRKAEEDLRDLSRRLISAQEEERALLARELHDDVSQRLAVLAIDAGRAELAADGSQAEALRTIRMGLVGLSDDVHALAYQLHPSVLEELGLVEALRAECERRSRQGHAEITMDVGELSRSAEGDAALCLFRIAQEALNNVAHHADARSAGVALRQKGEGLLLEVTDDGVGFEPERLEKGAHLGIVGMRERARLAHGSLDIESSPGHGAKVVAWVPAEETA